MSALPPAPSQPEPRHEFERRAEAAWEEYQRTGQSRPMAEVLERIEALIAERRRQLTPPATE